MRSSSDSDVTSTPGAARAHSRFRAKMTGSAARPALVSAFAFPTSAEANTSAGSPLSMRSRRRPEAPKVAAADAPSEFEKACAISVIAARKLPAAKTRTGSAATAVFARTKVKGRTSATRSSTGVRGVRIEQLLPIDLVVGDSLLPRRRDKPVNKLLAKLLLDVWMLLRVDQNDPVLIEQPLVALDQDFEIAAVLEREPGAAIGEDVGVHRGRRVERRAHALSRVPIPRALALVEIDAGSLPQLEFGHVSAAAVTPRD